MQELEEQYEYTEFLKKQKQQEIKKRNLELAARAGNTSNNEELKKLDPVAYKAAEELARKKKAEEEA